MDKALASKLGGESSSLVIAVSECKIERSNYLEFEWVTQTQTPMIDLPNEELLQ